MKESPIEDIIKNIAIQIENPGVLWTQDDERQLHADLISYAKGELAEEDAEILAELIAADSRVATQFERCLESISPMGRNTSERTPNSSTLASKGDASPTRPNEGGASEIVPFPTFRCRVSFASSDIAASDYNQPPQFKVFDVEGFSESLMIEPRKDGIHATVRVFDEGYESSTSLDGVRLEIGEGSFAIHGGRVVVPLHETCLEFRLISADGQDLSLRERA